MYKKHEKFIIRLAFGVAAIIGLSLIGRIFSG